MAVLELHRGGRDPVELARLEEEAMHAMTALAGALSPLRPASPGGRGAHRRCPGVASRGPPVPRAT